jgi:hypothetical protein
MEGKMTKEQLAKKLNNIQYPVRLEPEIIGEAKENGLVIVYGASDDLMEFDGAIYDEAGVYDGGIVSVDKEGLLPCRDDIEDDETLKNFFKREETARIVEAMWCKVAGYCWTYNTDIPHATFEVMEDDETYCKGIVFALADI